jgi:hypothetical protein
MGQTFRGNDRDSWRNRNKNNKKHSNRNGVADGKFIEKSRLNRFDNITQDDEDDNYPEEDRNHR